jgi:hypothetical protein
MAATIIGTYVANILRENEAKVGRNKKTVFQN